MALLTVMLLGLQLTEVRAAAADARPNVVLIITDDVGYGDIGSYGAPDVRTPNIDSLARDGVKMTDFYANAATCSPTRAGLVTGRYQQRFAIENPIQMASTQGERGLPASGRSLPQLLKNGGYATALIGKWHLGYKPEFSPMAHGYEYFFGFKSGYTDYYQHVDGDGNPDLFENDKPVTVEGYMTDLITERSIGFIERSARSNSPFFLEVAYNAAHWPYQVPGKPSTAVGHGRHVMPDEAPTNSRAEYVAILEHADKGIGRILQALDRLSLEKDTIVIFTNDNGGEWLSRNAPLFNRKTTLWEGGIRVPLLVRWPGRLPAGKVSPQVGITMDLSATILAATQTVVPADTHLEGIDLFPALSGQSPLVERTLFWRLLPRQRAVRSGDWKLIVDGNNMLLYDVRNDVGERDDLTPQRTDVIARLRPLLAAWEKDVDAESRANGSGFNRGPAPPGPGVNPAARDGRLVAA